MKKFATHFALLALAGTMAAPAFAAAPSGPSGSGGGKTIDCTDPAMAKLPACQHKGKPGMRGPAMGGPGMKPMAPGGKPPPPMHHKPPPPPGHMAPGPMAPGHMQPGHKGPPPGFDAFRHSFHFPHFAPPPFHAREGFVVPRSYHHSLRPLPRSFFGFYPMYRGYLFFVTPSGDIVIVSPRTFRIVAIL
jgi:hypothetical protein